MLSLLPILSLVQHPSCLLGKKGELWAPSVLSSGLGGARNLSWAVGSWVPGAQDSRKGWPKILALGWEPWRRKIGLSRLPLLPVPAQAQACEVPGGQGVVWPRSSSHFNPWSPGGLYLPSRYTMQNFPDLRTQLPCPLVLPERLQLLLSPGLSLPHSLQTQLQSPSSLWPSQLRCLRFCPAGELPHRIS